MTCLLLAQFSDRAHFLTAARRMHDAGHRLRDAFTPFPVEEILDLLPQHRSHSRVVMFVAGIGMAAIAYGLEYFSAVTNYPYNSGGRPLDAWPAFMLVPFATGILVAAVAGFTTLLVETGLPRLHHPLFAVDGFERASQDHFILAIEAPPIGEGKHRVVGMLRDIGAARIQEIER
ncbi:MAG: DUF3341 domain-containing protein [Hyphomicrobiales bacterium]|nr:DUF3341 domain-containing protein [Hyphomicrobiales bacterium]MDE2284646.1 DUF3341 domain-containing protein [Hyphomicrobiales bacterium]